MPEVVKICAFCGKQFTATGRNAGRQKYCSGPHYQTCKVCGKVFEIFNLSDGIKECCSAECRNKLKVSNMRKTMLSKYVAENPSNVPELKKRAAETAKSKQAAIRESREKTMNERYGVSYALQSEAFKEKFRETCVEKYGVDNPSKSEEIKRRFLKSIRHKTLFKKLNKLLWRGMEHCILLNLKKFRIE